MSTPKPLLAASLLMMLGVPANGLSAVGADIPWTTYEAEGMHGNGQLIGPGYQPNTIETESSHQQCVRLPGEGAFLEFTAAGAANALIVRYSLPDAPQGGGTISSLVLLVNGQAVRTLALSSRNCWLYGSYPFTNDPSAGKPRNFYDEVRVKDLSIAPGDSVRLLKTQDDGVPVSVDLVDLEDVPAPLAAPEGALSVRDFGAVGDGKADDTDALRACVAAAREKGVAAWVPPGDYKITGDIVLESGATIQGAGMWHSTFVGDETLYGQADRRVRFRLRGGNIRVADFAIVGALNYRNDQEPNDGIIGAGVTESTVSRIWVEHTKCGAWVYNGTKLLVEGCRFRNAIADGINLCVGTKDNVIENCSARGTGDDCFALWPAALDQGFVDERVVPGNNVIRRCTGQLTFLANGACVYGGADNRIEDCLFTDIGTGCGILLSTSFLTADTELGIDNNFSGTTVVRNNTLVRCGGWDHTWTWRAALQICMERKSISGLHIEGIEIRDSFSDGVGVVAPGSAQGNGTLSHTRLVNVSVSGVGLGSKEGRGFFIREDARGGLSIEDCEFPSILNASASFTIRQE